ncbi:MAG: ABC transporter substrate-binding protein [Dehalococcoidia bacterium]
MKIKKKKLSALLALGLVTLLIIAACGEAATPTSIPEVLEEEEVVEEEVVEEEVVEEEVVMEEEEEVVEEVVVLEEQPLSGGTLRITGIDPPTFDLTRSTSYLPAEVLSFTHIQLTAWDFTDATDHGDYTPRPDLAESWEASEDGLTVTFHLRQGILWQDIFPVSGREVTADDVVFSYNQYLSPESPNRLLLGPLESVTAPDRYTVVFEFSEPYAPFMTHTSNDYFPIYAPEVLEEFGDFSTAETVIGAGPWILESYERGVGMTFVRNPDYYRGENGITGESLPYIDRIEVSIVPDRDARAALYRAGDVDIPGSCGCFGLWNVYIDELEQLQEDRPDLLSDLRTFSSSAYNLYWFAPKLDQFPFMSQKVRQAINMVLDRGDAWTVSVAGPTIYARELTEGHPWYVPFEELGEGAQYYPRDAEGNPIRDVEGALVLMDEGLQELIDQGLAPAGFQVGDRIAADLNSTAAYDEFIVAGTELISSWLSDIYFDLTIKMKEYGDFISTTFLGDYDGLGFGYESTYIDVDEMFYGLFYPGTPKNRAGVDDPELNALILAQRAEFDPIARAEIIRELQKLAAVKQYNWMMPNYTTYNAFPPYVKNAGPHKKYSAGRMWLYAWLTEDAPGRQ